MFDLVNFDIGGHSGHGMPFDGTVTGRRVKGRTYKPRTNVRSDEVKAAEALAKALNTLDDFDVHTFAYFFTQKSPEINVRMFKIFEALIIKWAENLDTEMTRGPAEEAIAIEAKRLIDAYNSLFKNE